MLPFGPSAPTASRAIVDVSWFDLGVAFGLILIAVGIARWQGVGLAQRLVRNFVELDENRRIAREVGHVEERFGAGRQDGLLLAHVLDPHGQDRALRRRLVAEPLEICLAERPLPGEALARDEPGPVAVP